MENNTYEYADELSHHGTKGMRWGVRRYQNSDGSLTDAGRKRYGSEDSKPRMSFKDKRIAKQKAKEAEARKKARLEAMQRGKDEKKKQVEEEAKKIAETAKKREEVLKSRSAKTIYENAHLFSDAELNAIYNRLNTERNIANLAPKEVSKGEKFIDNMINTGRKVNDIADVGTKLYNHMARLHNSLSDSGDKWPLIKDNDKKQNGGNNQKKDNNKKSNGNNNPKKDNGKNNQHQKKDNDKKEKETVNNKQENTKETKNDTKSNTERYEAKPEDIIGEGTSRSNIKNGSDWVKKTAKDWDVESHTPATVERGEAYMNRLLANEDEYMQWYLD